MDDRQAALVHTLPGTEERIDALGNLADRFQPLDSLADRLEDMEDREYARAVRLQTGRNGRIASKTPADEKATGSCLPPELGKRIRTLRLRAGMSQRDLAGEIHVTRQHVGWLESGTREPSFSTACELARVLNVSLDVLAGDPERN